MSSLKITNTLSGEKEIFQPIKKGLVGMYNCGPTVYDFVHIGNLRAYVFADILRRTLEVNSYKVTQVVNITDIGHLAGDGDSGEDKMTKGLKREGKPFTLEAMKELADFYTERFKEDLRDLNIQMPTHLPKASEHIKEDIVLIKKLEEKNFTYKTSDGVYFDTSKDADYGKLGGLSAESTESRIGINDEKKNSRDFALWKFNDKLGFESPWGKGFPGWHIECSAMSMKYLGETFDLHTGGIDHISVHHNNEIAQSESATGKPFVHYWLHNAFVNIGNEKMAKSDGNFLRIQTLKDRKISPLAYRLWLLGARYSTPMNFSWEAMEGAQNSLKKLQTKIQNLGEKEEKTGKPDQKYLEKFTEFVNDDLDTPRALALLWKVLDDAELSPKDKKATVLEFDKVLGLKLDAALDSETSTELPEEIKKLAEKRENTRKNKDWKTSDTLREELEKLGFKVKDTDAGQKISKK